MNQTPKTVLGALFVSLFFASSLGVFGVTNAQSPPKPSVPEFTITVSDHSYTVEAKTTTTEDPYDGRITTTTTPGYYAVNGTIEFRIKNPPFTPYYNSDGYPVKLYYDIRAKGLDTSFWYYLPGSAEEDFFEASNSEYTTYAVRYYGHCFTVGMGEVDIKADGSIDFQVEAFIGHKEVTVRYSGAPVVRSTDLFTEYFGEKSGWSVIQTAVIPNAAYTPITPPPLPTNPPPTRTFSEPTVQPTNVGQTGVVTLSVSLSFFLMLVAIAVVVAVVMVVVVVVVLNRKPT